ncbi:SPOR domain-containing protein [Gilliamella apis]|uniref:SPOR domain-containing protein n=1 Tax=Gilliamella apis TaxID=1970738 RepID=UPI002741FC13|nr:SPOR domain-containing protein [Gilliamella apis]WLT07348.1 SPOR domain-containing protein [Gilliamella apis]
MRVDKDDRYIPEQSNKPSTPSFSITNFFQHYSKKKLIIMGLTIVIIVLLVSTMLFRSSKPKTPTPLTPPEVSGVSTTQEPEPTITTQANDVATDTTQGQASSTVPTPMAPAPITDVNEQQNSSELTGNNGNEANTQRLPENKPESQIDQNTHQDNNVNNRPTLPNKVESKVNNNLTKIDKIKSNQFSIQLSASTSLEGLKKLAKKHNLTNYQIYETKRNNAKWFILVNGTYDSAAEAKKAIKSLPDALQKDKPWVKSGATINKEKSAK